MDVFKNKKGGVALPCSAKTLAQNQEFRKKLGSAMMLSVTEMSTIGKVAKLLKKKELRRIFYLYHRRKLKQYFQRGATFKTRHKFHL